MYDENAPVAKRTGNS